MTAPASEEKRPDVGVHGDTVTVICAVERPLEYEPKTWTFDELRDVFPKSDGNLVRPLLDEVVALRAALAERTRERDEAIDRCGAVLLESDRAKSDAAACAERVLDECPYCSGREKLAPGYYCSSGYCARARETLARLRGQSGHVR